MGTMATGWLALVCACGLVSAAWAAEEAPARQAAATQATRPSSRPAVRWNNPQIGQMPGLTHATLQSKAIGQEVGYAVWLPPGYAASQDRYPVIYFLHGSGGNESQDAPAFSGMVAKAVQDGTLPPVICVFPNGGQSGYRGAVETMILDELMPLIDGQYRTVASRQGRVLAGFSMGGSGAMQLVTKYPERFAAAASWAGSTMPRNQGLYETTKANAEKLKALKTGLMIVIGEKDRKDEQIQYVDLLKQLGLAHQFILLPEVPHNLGLFYEQAGTPTMQFLGQQLRAAGSAGQ